MGRRRSARGRPPPVDEVNEVKESDGDSDLDQVSEVKD